MTTAAAATNMQQLGEKQSRERAWQQYEINRDRVDLAHVNASTLNPSATQSMGVSGKFQM